MHEREASVTDTTPGSANPIKVSIQVQPQHASYEQQRAAWVAADELGVDVIFNWDHFYPLSGDPDGKHFEAYTLLAAMAEVTERAMIAPLVTCNSYRNPNLLADMARTIDHISGGRFILGIGSGWFEKDYNEYGYEFGTAASRLQALKRDLPIIEARFAKLNPGPVNGHIPVLIGGGGEKVTLRLVAKHADIWHGFGDLETATRKSAILNEWCAKEGRDPNEIERSVGISPQTQKDLDGFIAQGITHFTTNASGPDYDFGFLRELIQWRDSRSV
jgi:probable F420-dependent oxidoreductase